MTVASGLHDRQRVKRKDGVTPEFHEGKSLRALFADEGLKVFLLDIGPYENTGYFR